jgi:hypothetical protein
LVGRGIDLKRRQREEEKKKKERVERSQGGMEVGDG